MALYNCDGQPYVLNGSLTQFNPENPDINLFNLYDQEIINIGGTPFFYYELMLQQNTIDLTYREDKGKIFNPNPIQLYGLYEPAASQNYQSMFGIDGPSDIEVQVNYSTTLQLLGGGPPKIGSRLFMPLLREWYEVVQNNVLVAGLWSVYRIAIIATRYQNSVSDQTTLGTTKQMPYTFEESILFSAIAPSQSNNNCS